MYPSSRYDGALLGPAVDPPDDEYQRRHDVEDDPEPDYTWDGSPL